MKFARLAVVERNRRTREDRREPLAKREMTGAEWFFHLPLHPQRPNWKLRRRRRKEFSRACEPNKVAGSSVASLRGVRTSELTNDYAVFLPQLKIAPIIKA